MENEVSELMVLRLLSCNPVLGRKLVNSGKLFSELHYYLCAPAWFLSVTHTHTHTNSDTHTLEITTLVKWNQ